MPERPGEGRYLPFFRGGAPIGGAMDGIDIVGRGARALERLTDRLREPRRPGEPSAEDPRDRAEPLGGRIAGAGEHQTGRALAPDRRRLAVAMEIGMIDKHAWAKL